jgi:DNA end-binding protein Ku
MAARSQWKGFLKISLVSVPVKAYTTTTSGGSGIQLNQLHAECNSRIQYKKSCPIHGEVKQDQIVSGYEYAKDQYVVVDTDELEKLRTEDDKAIRVDVFFPADALDPVYLTGKNYFLVPEGPVGQKAYQVIYKGMTESGRNAIAQVVMHGKEQLVMLRPHEGVLVMSVLNFASQVSSASAFDEEIPKGPVDVQELQLVKTLIKGSATDKLDLSKYKDVYTEKLAKLIEAKVAGQELVSPPPAEHAHVINLMDALKQSVAQIQKGEGRAAGAEPADTGQEAKEAAAKKPPRKMAPSKGAPAAQTKKKKSS